MPQSDRPVVAELRAGRRGSLRFVASSRPDLTWRVSAAPDGWRQASAVLERRTADGRIHAVPHRSDESAMVAWPFDPLTAYETAHVRVTVEGGDGRRSLPSAWVAVEAGPPRPGRLERRVHREPRRPLR
ncbi:MAG: hypothetical protein ACTH0E_04385 [Candidatus Microbacterium stercoravium]